MWQYLQTEMLCKRKRIGSKNTRDYVQKYNKMWNLKCTIAPLKIGVTGIVMRSLRKNLEAVTGKHLIDSLQKTAILGTSHIVRKVLQCES